MGSRRVLCVVLRPVRSRRESEKLLDEDNGGLRKDREGKAHEFSFLLSDVEGCNEYSPLCIPDLVLYVQERE